jgi:type IV pilus assembly protein PilV
MSTQSRAMNRNAGFTLIEVLVATLVLTVGLLGLAGLQITNLVNNRSAYNRSQTTIVAYDLADRMRANAAGVAASTYTTVLPAAAAAKANCLTTTGCASASDMAENDLYEWNRMLSATLPSGVGSIAVSGGVFTITIRWDDDQDGDIDNDDPRFQTSFRL